jgi:ATP-dependent RNA helicase SUPV3L1/SUV3
MQENLRALREQWKQTDQGGVPNHAMWKRFDEACNEAHKVVEAWLEKIRTEAAEHRAQRLALIEEVKAWAAANTTRWTTTGAVSPASCTSSATAGAMPAMWARRCLPSCSRLWKQAIGQAAAPLEALQALSIAQRQAMIEEAKVLGAAPHAAHRRRQGAAAALAGRGPRRADGPRLEQKLWDAFRKPIDEAFERKTQERQKAEAALGEHDRMVLEAAKALEAANATG